MEINKGKLQEVQQIISTYSLLPLKLYKIENGKIIPYTHWTNASFLHWIMDTHDFKDEFSSNPYPDFSSFGEILSSIIKEKIKKTLINNLIRNTADSSIEETIIDSQNYERLLDNGIIQDSWAKKNWETLKFNLFGDNEEDSGPYFYLTPARKFKKNGDQIQEQLNFIVLTGGFFISTQNTERDVENFMDKLDNLIAQGASNSLIHNDSFEEKRRFYVRVLLEELNELGEITDDEMIKNKLRASRACLSVYISDFSELESISTVNLVKNLYRFISKENTWKNFFNAFKQEFKRLTGRDDILEGMMLVLKPVFQIENIEGTAIGIYNKGENSRIYIFTSKEEGNKEYYFNGKLTVTPEDIIPGKIYDWVKNKKSEQHAIVIPLKNYGSIVLYLEEIPSFSIISSVIGRFKGLGDERKKSEIVEFFMPLISLIKKEIETYKAKSNKFYLTGENRARILKFELIKDIVNYSYLNSREDLRKLLESLEVTLGKGVTLDYYIPAFYIEDGEFERLEEKNLRYYKLRVVYQKIFESGNPSVEDKSGIFIPIRVAGKIISVLKCKTRENKCDLISDLLRIGTLLGPKIIFRRFQETLSEIDRKLRKINIDFHEQDFFILSEKANYIAERITRFFGLHSTTLWIYLGTTEKFQILGVANKPLAKTIEENCKKKSHPNQFYKNELPFISKLFNEKLNNKHSLPKIKTWVLNNKINLRFENYLKENDFKKGFGAYFGDENFGVVVTLWTKFDYYSLTSEDEKLLTHIGNYIYGYIESLYRKYREKYISDELQTFLHHELKITLSSARYAIEKLQVGMDKYILNYEKDLRFLLESVTFKECEDIKQDGRNNYKKLICTLKELLEYIKGKIENYEKYWIYQHKIGEQISIFKKSQKFFSNTMDKKKISKFHDALLLYELAQNDVYVNFITSNLIFSLLPVLSEILQSQRKLTRNSDSRTYSKRRVWFWSEIVNFYIKRFFYQEAYKKNLEIKFSFDKEEFDNYMCLTELEKNIVIFILRNLVSNAIKYSYPDTEINISGKTQGLTVEVLVENLGVEIKESEENKIFYKGYRGENAKDTVGLGWGLFLSQQMARFIRGKISLVKPVIETKKINKTNKTATIFKFEFPYSKDC